MYPDDFKKTKILLTGPKGANSSEFLNNQPIFYSVRGVLGYACDKSRFFYTFFHTRYDRNCNRLKEEIERLKRVEKEKDSLEIDNDRLKDQINQLQIRWNKLKSDRLQKKEIAQEVMNLKEQKFKLENDKLLLRQEILSLQEKYN